MTSVENPSAPCGASTADPVLLEAFVAVNLASWTASCTVQFGNMRSLAFGFCEFLAVLGISGKSWEIYGGSLALILSAGDGQDLQSLDQKSVLKS